MRKTLFALIAISFLTVPLYAYQDEIKASPDSERAKLVQELKISEQAVSDLAKENQDASDEKITEVVKKAFLAKQALQQHDLKRTKEKLAKLESQLAQRDASMKVIIERRVAELRSNHFDDALESTDQSLESSLEQPNTIQSNDRVRPSLDARNAGSKTEGNVSLWEMKRQMSQSLALVTKFQKQFGDQHPRMLAMQEQRRDLMEAYLTQLRLLEIDLKDAESQVEMEQTFLDRREHLHKQGLVSSDEVVNAKHALDKAKFDLERVNERFRSWVDIEKRYPEIYLNESKGFEIEIQILTAENQAIDKIIVQTSDKESIRVVPSGDASKDQEAIRDALKSVLKGDKNAKVFLVCSEDLNAQWITELTGKLEDVTQISVKVPKKPN